MKIKEVEAVLFVPSMPNSDLRKMIQKAEDQAARLMNSPSIRVVERSGTKIMEKVGGNNHWKKEWACLRKDCLPCKGQLILGAGAEEEALKQVYGEEGKPENNKEGMKKTAKEGRSLPGCTNEGGNYVIECLPCRKAGIVRRYFGETSRSSYQRGREHLREVEQGVATHPLVLHFREEHQEETQPIMMRILSRHLTALEREVILNL